MSAWEAFKAARSYTKSSTPEELEERGAKLANVVRRRLNKYGIHMDNQQFQSMEDRIVTGGVYRKSRKANKNRKGRKSRKARKTRSRRN